MCHSTVKHMITLFESNKPMKSIPEIFLVLIVWIKDFATEPELRIKEELRATERNRYD